MVAMLGEALRLLACTAFRRGLRGNATGRHALVLHRTRAEFFAFAHQPEVDLATVKVDAAHLHTHARADGIANARAFAAKFLPLLIELEVLAAEFGDVH